MLSFSRFSLLLPALLLNSTTPYEPNLNGTFIGNVFHSLPSRYGGFVEGLVSVGDTVSVGQPVAHVRNSWGDVLNYVLSPVAAGILNMPSDTATEPDEDAAQLVYYSTEIPDCEAGCIVTSRDAIPPKK